eukprot:Clim_evm9s60 gene=Clim_evmTU9s60
MSGLIKCTGLRNSAVRGAVRPTAAVLAHNRRSFTSDNLTQFFGFTEIQKDLSLATERFGEKHIKPIAAEVDRKDEFPMHLWKELGNAGLLGVTAPEKYGGLGLNYMDHVVVLEQFGRYSCAIGLSIGAHSNLCINQLRLNGSEAQMEKYLPDLCAGDKVGGLAMSEHGSGSDVVSMSMHAKQDSNGDFILNGSKMWCTNGPIADTLIVYGKTEPDKGPHGITAFIIERGMEGFSNGIRVDKYGHRGSPTGELVFEDCRVPKENVLGGVNKGVKVLMSGLDYERVTLAAMPVGLMSSALDYCVPYLHERKQFGQEIGAFQLMQAKLAALYSKTMAMRSYMYTVARACDDPTVDRRSLRKDAASLILMAGEMSVECASDAVQIFGGNGLTNDYPVGRLLRDCKLYTIGGGTHEMRQMLIGREIMQDSR